MDDLFFRNYLCHFQLYFSIPFAMSRICVVSYGIMIKLLLVVILHFHTKLRFGDSSSSRLAM